MNNTLDWNQYLNTAAEAVAEGIILLRNENNALPLNVKDEIAIFGRIQLHYYKSGTGSGGMVNVSKVTGILDGLVEAGANINRELLDAYQSWDAAHPFDLGDGWGAEPWCQDEMPLDESLVERVSKTASAAVVIIGRTAGEEQDNHDGAGSYQLSADELAMLKIVRSHFSRVIVLLNVGNIMDMSFIDTSSPDAVLYVWQGGMTGGTGTASVLLGKVSPSGKLPDTIAYHITDYPSSPYFGDRDRNFYSEDIYVGYRYFETFAREAVRFPFGFGLSYTKFSLNVDSVHITEESVTISVTVRNTGSCSGKEVVQLYCEAPQGKLGKPARVLCGYEKTRLLQVGEFQTIALSVPFSALASYDDSGVTGHRFCHLLEAGDYRFYVGTDVRSADFAAAATLQEDIVIQQCTQAMAPVLPFERIRPKQTSEGLQISMEPVPLLEIDESQRRLDALPKEQSYTGDRGIRLCDVRNGTAAMADFIAQLSDEDLAAIIRGEGMGSPRVTAGTASAFGGVTDSLSSFGIPCGCCSDGPSGMRLDCGTKAFSLPNGTMLASTFNPDLITTLFTMMGLEMQANKVDCLLGPGMNIHRHPLNGRNFEYFSEDPFLTGTIASAQLHGLHSAGVTGTIKHFCGNNQETNRHFLDDAVSERALREIYLKGFEIAVKEGCATSIMTTYGSVNGIWTAGSYDLNTQILRNEWGFTGFVMTDWWANINQRGCEPDKNDFAAMARAQNDVYMVCADSSNHTDNTLSALAEGTLTRGELQRNAANICRFLLDTNAMRRICGEETGVTVINRPDDESDSDAPVAFYDVDRDFTLSLDEMITKKGGQYSFTLIINRTGNYRVTITASSDQSELAQIPVTLFSMGTANGTFTWNGTGGKPVSHSKEDIPFFSRFTTIRLYFAQSGLKLHSIRFTLQTAGADPTKLL